MTYHPKTYLRAVRLANEIESYADLHASRESFSDTFDVYLAVTAMETPRVCQYVRDLIGL